MSLGTNETLLTFGDKPSLYQGVGLALLGLQPTQAFIDRDDYARHGLQVGAPWFEDTAGTGSANAQFAQPAGVLRLASGATANSRREYLSPGVVTNTKTKLWYFAAEFALPTAVDAQGRMYFGFRTADLTTESIAVGAVGAVDTANFVLQYGGHFTGSKVVLGALNVSKHIFEAWNNDRNSYNVRFDGGAIQNAVPGAGMTVSNAISRGANNGTTAADRQIDLDWHVYVGERA